MIGTQHKQKKKKQYSIECHQMCWPFSRASLSIIVATQSNDVGFICFLFRSRKKHRNASIETCFVDRAQQRTHKKSMPYVNQSDSIKRSHRLDLLVMIAFCNLCGFFVCCCCCIFLNIRILSCVSRVSCYRCKAALLYIRDFNVVPAYKAFA